jgi:Ser/Thr protein kinase RdoA (MazF antagonist)
LQDTLRERLARFGSDPHRYGLVHADLRLANLLVHGDETYVIDFDDCGWSWFLYDFGAAVSFFEHDPRIPELSDAWVRGYRTVRHLPAEDEAEIPTFVMMRRLLLVAWIGSHSGTDLARSMGAEYTAGSLDLAEGYLSRWG